MEYEKYYELRWGWCYVGSTYCYNEYKVFLTEAEINKYRFELFHNPHIKIEWCKQICVEDWKNYT